MELTYEYNDMNTIQVQVWRMMEDFIQSHSIYIIQLWVNKHYQFYYSNVGL